MLVFDVNETLIDFESMSPLFERLFGDKRVLREWFGHLVMYSMTVTLSGLYEPYFSLGRGLLKMVGDIHGVKVTESDVDELETGMRGMPAHRDVEEGLTLLKDAGFRMVTLTNSPHIAGEPGPLERAGIDGYFERQFTIDTIRAYKPSHHAYHMVAQDLGVPAASCLMVATHVWDTVGAESAGFSGGLVTRPGNALLPLPGLPQPHVVAGDLPGLAQKLIERRRS
ncbi:haloacid dehalogenase [Streptomyces sp. 150FB]|nr:haloacid dehalogenase [Streptomyces sp. 150FB]